MELNRERRRRDAAPGEDVSVRKEDERVGSVAGDGCVATRCGNGGGLAFFGFDRKVQRHGQPEGVEAGAEVRGGSGKGEAHYVKFT